MEALIGAKPAERKLPQPKAKVCLGPAAGAYLRESLYGEEIAERSSRTTRADWTALKASFETLAAQAPQDEERR
jgi:hypothetical protein